MRHLTTKFRVFTTCRLKSEVCQYLNVAYATQSCAMITEVYTNTYGYDMAMIHSLEAPGDVDLLHKVLYLSWLLNVRCMIK